MSGLKLETFHNLNVSGAPAKTETVDHVTLTGISISSVIQNLDAIMDQLFHTPPTEISHRFTGYYQAASAGKYILALEYSGEGSGNRVYLDDKLIVDNWKLVRAFQPHVTLDLTAGPHKIVVEEWQKAVVGGHLALAIAPESGIVNKSAVQLAAKADAVVVEAGYWPDNESEAGDRTFALPFGQDEMIREISAANPEDDCGDYFGRECRFACVAGSRAGGAAVLVWRAAGGSGAGGDSFRQGQSVGPSAGYL